MTGLAPVIENWCTKPGPDGDTGCGIGLQVGCGNFDIPSTSTFLWATLKLLQAQQNPTRAV